MNNKYLIYGITFVILLMMYGAVGLVNAPDTDTTTIMVHDLDTDELYDITVPLVPNDSRDFTLEGLRDLEQEAEIECLALNIYHEARSDNYAGKYAVADVVLNRQRDRRYPDKICDVIKQGYTRPNGSPIIGRCQFSWYCDGLSDVPKETVAYQEALSLAQQMVEHNFMRGITDGATHYHAYYVTPDWVNDRGMINVGRIGDHIFYQLN